MRHLQHEHQELVSRRFVPQGCSLPGKEVCRLELEDQSRQRQLKRLQSDTVIRERGDTQEVEVPKHAVGLSKQSVPQEKDREQEALQSKVREVVQVAHGNTVSRF